MLELLYRPLIILHILTGTIAMGASIIAFGASKWSKTHKYAGLAFFWSMLITAIASIPPAITSEKWVLLLLSVFSFHLAYSGKRFLNFRRGESAHMGDYLVSGLAVVYGILLWGFGVPFFYQHMGILGAIAPFVFGLISLAMAREDFQWYEGQNQCAKLALRRHIGRMGGATISVFTAFFVNVNFVLPGGIAWILPTVLGAVLIARFSGKVQRDQPIR